MNRSSASAIQPGERAPFCSGITSDRRQWSFEEQYGRPVILLLVGAEALGGLPTLVDAFGPWLDAIADRNAGILVLTGGDPSRLHCNGIAQPGIPMIGSEVFLQQCGVHPQEMLVLVLDRDMRVAMQTRPSGHADIAIACLRCLDELPRDDPADVIRPAPVLMLPNLISRDLCQTLINWFETRQSQEGAAALTGSGPKPDREVLIPPGDELDVVLQHRLLTLCAPEILKAFQVSVAHTGRLRIVCHHTRDRGFPRHRENTGDDAALREFAIFLNLNTYNFDGGHILFPEYNDHRHVPPPGAGLIFSTAILYQTAPVVFGRRYALLTSFHSMAAEARRLVRATRSAELS